MFESSSKFSKGELGLKTGVAIIGQSAPLSAVVDQINNGTGERLCIELGQSCTVLVKNLAVGFSISGDNCRVCLEVVQYLEGCIDTGFAWCKNDVGCGQVGGQAIWVDESEETNPLPVSTQPTAISVDFRLFSADNDEAHPTD